jgi:hypothetical protein
VCTIALIFPVEIHSFQSITATSSAFIGDETAACAPAFLSRNGSAMKQRRGFRKQPPLDQRLAERAKRLREEAQAAPPGVERDKLNSLAQQAEAAAKMGEWLSLPHQRAP